MKILKSLRSRHWNMRQFQDKLNHCARAQKMGKHERTEMLSAKMANHISFSRLETSLLNYNAIPRKFTKKPLPGQIENPLERLLPTSSANISILVVIMSAKFL